MARTALKTITTAAALLASTAIYAGSSPFSLVGGGLVPGVDVTLTVQESTQPGYDYDFVVNNNSVAGYVTGVYFEQLWNGKLYGAGTSFGDATLYPGSENPEIPGWVGPKSSHTVSNMPVYHRIGRGAYITYEPMIEYGIAAGSSQTFSFTTDTNIISLDDLMDVVGSEGFGVAIRLHGDSENPNWGLAEQVNGEEELVMLASFIQDDGSQVSDTSGDQKVTGAPTPTAAFAGLAMLGAMGLRRRRR